MESKELELLARAKRLAKIRDPGEYVLKRDFRVRVEPELKKVFYEKREELSWKVIGSMDLSPGLEREQAAAVVLFHRLLGTTERERFFSGDFKDRLDEALTEWYLNGGRRTK